MGWGWTLSPPPAPVPPAGPASPLSMLLLPSLPPAKVLGELPTPPNPVLGDVPNPSPGVVLGDPPTPIPSGEVPIPSVRGDEASVADLNALIVDGVLRGDGDGGSVPSPEALGMIPSPPGVFAPLPLRPPVSKLSRRVLVNPDAPPPGSAKSIPSRGLAGGLRERRSYPVRRGEPGSPPEESWETVRGRMGGRPAPNVGV